ncbi:hypothetical protein J4403_03105 [Candidatus Woesearchaeota archaeon]|nr:hypothetical protein [Candidatus Woesearchaeota archaeon]
MIYLTITGLENVGIDYKLILLVLGIIILIIIIIALIKFLRPSKPTKIGKIKLPSMNPILISKNSPKKEIVTEKILNKQDFKVESPIKQEDEFKKLKEYIKTVLDLRYSENEIRSVITAQGWKAIDIERAFEEAKKEDALEKAKQYVKQNLAKGFSKFQIAYILKNSGWPESSINNLFGEMKL